MTTILILKLLIGDPMHTAHETQTERPLRGVAGANDGVDSDNNPGRQATVSFEVKLCAVSQTREPSWICHISRVLCFICAPSLPPPDGLESRRGQETLKKGSR
jgi:hypothetical protein